MTTEQKDLMIANILDQIQDQICYLVSQDLIEESMALYREWEEHFDNDIQQVHILTLI